MACVNLDDLAFFTLTSNQQGPCGMVLRCVMEFADLAHLAPSAYPRVFWQETCLMFARLLGQKTHRAFRIAHELNTPRQSLRQSMLVHVGFAECGEGFRQIVWLGGSMCKAQLYFIQLAYRATHLSVVQVSLHYACVINYSSLSTKLRTTNACGFHALPFD